MSYRPSPIDTSQVLLPEDIEALSERLAENAHEIWADQRTQQGWTLGPDRNDALKQHPNLVPYQELPECEKLYDRRIAMETLKTIVSLGYHIQKQT